MVLSETEMSSSSSSIDLYINICKSLKNESEFHNQIVNSLSESISYSLTSHLTENAILLSEFWTSLEPDNAQAKHTLALSYFHHGDYNAVYKILRGVQWEDSKYLFAQACLHLNDASKLIEAESLLLTSLSLSTGDYYCLGVIAKRTSRFDIAIERFTKALSLNPFLFLAWKELSDLGYKGSPSNFFAASSSTKDKVINEEEDDNDDDTKKKDKKVNSNENGLVIGKNQLAPATPSKALWTPLSPISTFRLSHFTNLTQSTLDSIAANSHSTLNYSYQAIETPTLISNNSALAGAPATVTSTAPRGAYGHRSNSFYSKPQGQASSSRSFVTPAPPGNKSGGHAIAKSLDFSTPSTLPPMSAPKPRQKAARPSTSSTSSVISSSSSSSSSSTSMVTPSTSQVVNKGPKPKGPPPANPNKVNAASSKTLFAASPSSSPSAVEELSSISSDQQLQTPVQQDTRAPRRSMRLAKKTTSATSTSMKASTNSQQTTSKGKAPKEIVATTKVAITTPKTTAESGKGITKTPSNSLNNVNNEEDIEQDASEQAASASLLSFLWAMAFVYQKVCLYECQEAIALIDELPPRLVEASGQILCWKGRSYFEQVDYTSAIEAYKKARLAAPHQLEGMEIYSTALWHLSDDTELAYLALELSSINKLSPQVWTVVGNCFSLSKDHESALQFFQRSTQVDPNFTYAYTLAGHEFVANENFEKALTCYRTAIRIDPRHYNAWYGLGIIYHKQEKYELAEYHLRHALSIKANSSILHCFIGTALHLQRKSQDALSFLDQAIELDDKNPLAKLTKAKVLLSLDRQTDAIALLLQLKDYAPKEPEIYSLLGKAYKRLGDREKATSHYLIALDLDPKDPSAIKSSIERVNHDGGEGDDELYS